MKLGILPFMIGGSAPELVSDEIVEFYSWLSNNIFDKGDVFEQTNYGLYTIPISNDLIQNCNKEMEAKIYDSFQKLDIGSSLIIIDLANQLNVINRAVIQIQIARTIKDILDDEKMIKPIFVILLPELPSENDIVYEILIPYIQKNLILIINDKGEAKCGNESLPSFKPEIYSQKLKNARKNPSDLLEQKMIKRLGHFQRRRKDGSVYCNRLFFDGSLCDNEIKILIKEYLDIKTDLSPKTVFAYHCPMSNWFLNPLLSLGIDMDHKPIDLYPYLSDPNEINSLKNKFKPDNNCILFIDFVDTGRTIKNVYNLLLDCSINVIDIFVLLSTEGENKYRTIRYQKNNKQVIIKFPYVMKVNQIRYNETECPLCVMNIPKSNDLNENRDVIKPLVDEDDYLMIPTYDHWDIGFQAGFRTEDKHPPTRKGIHPLINYQKFIESNSAWITNKVKNRLKWEGLFSDVIIVIPDDEGSRLFSDNIRIILKKQVIIIPHEEIINCSQDEINWEAILSSWKVLKPEWYMTLSECGGGKAVIMEDYNFSAKTFLGIKNILIKLNLSVVAFFPLINLNPIPNAVTNIKLLSLYEWNFLS